MAPRPSHWQDISSDSFKMIHALAHLSERDGTVETNSITKGKAFSFRQRLYHWRRTVINRMMPHDSPEARETTAWLTGTFGTTRISKEWLDLTYFRVIQVDSQWIVRAGVDRPLMGSDIVFWDQSGGGKPREEDLARVLSRIDVFGKVKEPTPLVEVAPPPSMVTNEDLATLARDLAIDVRELAFDCERLTAAGNDRATILAALRSMFA